MREFFRGWRRKTGCITLIMALAALGPWMQSRVVTDEIWFRMLGRQHVIHIVAGHLVWSGGFYEGSSRFDWTSKARKEEDILLLYTQPILSGRVAQWTISFRTLCILLTLISAYLILWEPRKKVVTTHQPETTHA